VDRELAERIVVARDEIGGFSSVEDLGHVLHLNPELVEGLRDRTVSCPAEQANLPRRIAGFLETVSNLGRDRASWLRPATCDGARVARTRHRPSAQTAS
jgi:Helix-hairpin-helix motif